MTQPSTVPAGTWAAVTPKSFRPPQPTILGDQPICLSPETMAGTPVNPVGNNVWRPGCLAWVSGVVRSIAVGEYVIFLTKVSPAALTSAMASAASSSLNEVPSDKMPMLLSPWDLAQFTISWAYWALDGSVLYAVGFCRALNRALAPSPLMTSTCCCIRYGWI